MSIKPLVSIITPAYNYADLLPETIESVLDQDYPNTEYIVLDDGSTDNTREVLSRYDGKIIWETHENIGEAATVNKGFSIGKGDYFIIVNGDDPILPGCVSCGVTFMEEHPDVLVGYPRWYEIDECSEIIYEYPTFEFDLVNMVKWFHCMPGVGSIIRRKAVELTSGRDLALRWTSDIDLWFRIGLHGSLARIPHPLATHRIHPQAQTYKDKGVLMAKEYISVIKKWYKMDNLPTEIRAVKRQAFGMVYHIAGMMAVSVGDRKHAREYLLKSLWYYPFNHRDAPFGFKRSWKLFALNIFVPGWVRPLRLWLKRKLKRS